MTKEQEKAIIEVRKLRDANKRNSLGKSIYTVLNLITKLQKENKEKDKIIYEVAKSNVKLKGYEVEEKYIDTTIRFFTKYVKNLERNPQWRNDKNE